MPPRFFVPVVVVSVGVGPFPVRTGDLAFESTLMMRYDTVKFFQEAIVRISSICLTVLVLLLVCVGCGKKSDPIPRQQEASAREVVR